MGRDDLRITEERGESNRFHSKRGSNIMQGRGMTSLAELRGGVMSSAEQGGRAMSEIEPGGMVTTKAKQGDRTMPMAKSYAIMVVSVG